MKNFIDVDDLVKKEPNKSKQKPLTSEEHLESILYQFVTLYDQLELSRKKSKKQRFKLEKFIKEFSSEVDRLSKLDDYIIAKFKRSLEQTTVEFSNMVHNAVSHSVDRAIGDSVLQIRDSARQAGSLFSEYQSTLNWSHWKVIAITSLTSIVACLLVVLWLMPKPMLPLEDAQIMTYNNGVVF